MFTTRDFIFQLKNAKKLKHKVATITKAKTIT